MGWVAFVVDVVLKIFKAIFGIDRPAADTVTHPKPDIEISDGKTDEERLEDFGL